jgi:glycosyltransferase involved in cell wall biosynthesis
VAGEGLRLSNCALEAAARAQRPLLVLLGPVLAGNEPAATLLEALASDPLFGFAVGRPANENGELARLRQDLGDPDIEGLPRSALAGLPEHYIVPEVVGVCFVLRREVVANIGELDASFATSVGAWLQYLCRARRIGFRGVIVNRAVVRMAGGDTTSLLAPIPDDFWKLHRQYPDTGYAFQEFRRNSAHEYESLLARARSTEERKRKTLLVDARGMGPYYNGTTVCILGLMDGLAAVASDWHVSVLVRPGAGDFHRIPERYPGWTSFEILPDARFSIALRLSQPWDVNTLVELHSRALCNFYLELDTISWDILYSGATPEPLEAAWRFMAEYADGILFISDFSRQRYAMRFPPSPLVRQCVSYLPLHPGDYCHPQDCFSGDGYLLVVGNHLDHKWVAPTVELLATAFPFQSIHALGCGNVQLPGVTSVLSGNLSEEEVNRLFAGARLVVFPSFYEGFGFPVLQGLSCGKAVVARRSTLLDEIAAQSRAGGKLFAFSDPAELLEIVARLLRGDDSGCLPLATALANDEEPMRWPDIARNMLDFIAGSLQTPGYQWMRRMQSIQLHHGWK